ncbi:hypothetical protein CROQUDRAFT_655398 [Cronartium quercuum f. sp. fusiforme G11]|uniref:Uncharacterized protein n=1 Tax=Cronartium quercuum f. sp. fusiforme G11 TaxID=708437 RepID=A0A9P6TDQ9_9BASI|nr:hypothetical protein CROQUDRAFT_655398 [Cronartium quercuum f. sp. fusiforme G11]
MSTDVPLIVPNEGPECFLDKVADKLSASAALFAGQCHFPTGSFSDHLEGARTRLVEECLRSSQKIFDDALKNEGMTLPLVTMLVAHFRDQGPETRAQASKRRKNGGATEVEHTPLNALYLGSEAEGIILDDVAIWKQMKLRHEGVMGWVRQVLDQDNFEELDEDLMASKKKEALGLSDEDIDEEEEEALFDSDEMDLDDLDFLGDDDEDGLSSSDDDEASSSGHSESALEEGANASYVTGLNDEDDSDESEDEAVNHNSTRKVTPLGKGKAKSVNNSEADLTLDDLESRPQSKKQSKPRPKSKVDDDFFSLAEFEDEADQGEQQMRRQLRKWAGHSGEPEDEESSEEEVDLFANLNGGVLAEEDKDSEEEEDDDEHRMDLSTVADLRYSDFFDPPARLPFKKTKQKVTQAKPDKSPSKKTKSGEPTSDFKGKSPRVMFSKKVIVTEIPAKNRGLRVADVSKGSTGDDDDDDDEGEILLSDSDDDEVLSQADSSDSGSQENRQADDTDSQTESDASEDPEQRTMSRFSRDLFDDGFSDGDSDQHSSGSKDGQESLSRHAKKLKLLSKQIAELEAENVAKKDWTLKGEAAARDRPQNSLLEEDLEFEHIQKIAPAVTEEKTLGLEALIKQRILDGQFDDVIRRRAIDAKAFLPSRLLELQDTQSSRSLAEVYEDEYRASRTKAETGLKAVNPKDEKLNKEHTELKALFEDLCGKLDALSNAHFTPKQPKATIKTINNLPSIALESALPTATGAGTLLAPEELYAADPKAVQRDSTELTHVQKQAERRERKKDRKSQMKKIETITGKSTVAPGQKSVEKMSTKEQKENSLKALEKVEGVTIIGKRPLGAAEGPKKARKLESGAAYKL